MSANPSSKSPSDVEPEKYYQDFGQDDEIDLVDLLRPLWRQRFFIIAITLLAAIAALIYAFTVTPKYRVFTHLKPGIYRWNAKGMPIKLKTSDLKALLAGGIFNTYADSIGLGEQAPKIEVAADRKGEQVTAYFFWPDPEAGRKIMAGFIVYLNSENNTKNAGSVALDPTKKKTVPVTTASSRQPSGSTKANVNDHTPMATNSVSFLKEKIRIAEGTLATYEQQRHGLEKNTTEIISLRSKLLQTPQADSVQLLLLGSTIQENIAYLGTINEGIKAVRMEIADLQEMMARTVLVEMIVPPRSSIRPEKPKKKKIVALAGIMGLFLAVILAYLRHFWTMHREELLAGS